MPVLWADESYYAKEMKRWEKPYRYEEFPRMLYKAQFNPQSGRHEVALARDVISLDKTVVVLSAEAFNNSCQLIVNDEDGLRRAKADGWRESQKEAMDFHEGLQEDIRQAAAERAHQDRKMSERAQAEAAAVDVATSEHVSEIPRKRGRPRKNPTAA